MDQKRSIPRYAHMEGLTDVCYSEDGRYIITCGSEGDFRIWNGFDDDDSKAVCVGDKAYCVAQKGDKLYVGTDHNNVQVFTFPDAELDGILARFTAPVTSIDISKDGSFVAAGSADMEIRVVEEATMNVKCFIGHKAPILHVAIDPKLDFLSSSSCDGTVRIWNISDQKVIKEWEDVTEDVNSFKLAKRLCHVSWETLTGRLLAIPFASEIIVVQRDTWNTMMTLVNNQLTKHFSLTSWSNCGKFLAASTLGGEITVWNTLVQRIVSSSTDVNELNICSLRWNPASDQRQLAFCDVQGQLVVVDNCFPVSGASKAKSTVTKDTTVRVEPENDDFGFGRNVEEDEDDPEAISLDKIKSNYSGIFDEDQRSPKDNVLQDDDTTSVKSGSCRGPYVPVVDLQPPFQPTSTPAHLQRRFMVFNDVGYVRQTNTEEENVIDIDFHDASIHHAFRINNVLNHSMAALNSEALVLACEKSENTTSKLVCVLFKSWDSSKEWNIEITDEEDIQAIAVGNKWLAVATTYRFLRIFTLSGVQRELLRLPGPAVCLNALDDLLYIVYHSAMGLPGEQNLSFAIYQIGIGCTVLVSAQPLPLTPKSTLKWIGFSDQFNPCALDSEGILSLFVSSSGLWKPICCVDAQHKGSSNHHFIVGVCEERQNIRCILCKGSYYPSTIPHPFITEISWQIPLLELSMDKGMIEENYWRCSIAKECVKQESCSLNKDLLTHVLKLFSLSCKAGHEMRVLEFCDFTNSKDVTDLALKYAFRTRNEKLAERLTELQKVQQEMEVEDKSDYSDRVDPCNSISSNRLTNGDEYQSQELFPDSRNLSRSYAEPAQESVSLIAETKKKKSLSEQKNQILGQRKINPFKKSSQFDNSLNTPTQESSSSPVPAPAPEVKKSPNNAFSIWYESQKESLVKESPDLEEAELLKLAAKKFRQLKKSQETVVNNTVQTENDENKQSSKKKRKSTDDEASETTIQKRKSFLKLQEFVFKK